MPASSRKLTEADIREIWRLCSVEGCDQSEIAVRMGIKQPHVSLILNRKRWRHVRNPYRRQDSGKRLSATDCKRIAKSVRQDEKQVRVLATHYGIAPRRVRLIAQAYGHSS